MLNVFYSKIKKFDWKYCADLLTKWEGGTVVRQKAKKPRNAHMCVTTLHFPLSQKPNIAITEKKILQICRSLSCTLVYISPYVII